MRIPVSYTHLDVYKRQDAFVYNLFKADIGLNEEKVLHREQFRLLSSLLAGKNIAVSAPTSFGKSFVIDAFIKLRKPRNVAIIVPTIALTDETRRRIYKKFANEYNIITTTDIPLAERNIFIFPQDVYKRQGLDSFRDEMLNDRHLRIIHDFPETSDCFPGINIRGGDR